MAGFAIIVWIAEMTPSPQNVGKPARFVTVDVPEGAQKVDLLPASYYVDEIGGFRPPAGGCPDRHVHIFTMRPD